MLWSFTPEGIDYLKSLMSIIIGAIKYPGSKKHFGKIIFQISVQVGSGALFF